MQKESFFNGFLKEAGAGGMTLTSGADFLKKINSKLKSPISPNVAGKVTSGLKASSYSGLNTLKQTTSPAQVAAQNARHAAADKASSGLSSYAQNAVKTTGNAPSLRKELVGDHGVFTH